MSGALRIDDLSLMLNLILDRRRPRCAVLLAWRSHAAREAAHGEFLALLLTSVGGMSLLAAAQNTVALFVGLELLSIPLYVLCATRAAPRALARVGAEVPDRRLGRLGDAAVRARDDLRRDRRDRLRRDRERAVERQPGDRPADADRDRAVRRRARFKASVAPFHQWTPDVYEGAPTPITAFMAVATKVAALGVFLRFFDVALISTQRELGPGAGGARDDHDPRRQRRRARAVLAEADARLLLGRAGRLHARRRRRRDAARRAGDGLLPGRLPVHEHGRLRGDRRARARNRRSATRFRRVTGLGRERPLAGLADDASRCSRLAGIPATAGFIGQVLPDRCRRRRAATRGSAW